MKDLLKLQRDNDIDIIYLAPLCPDSQFAYLTRGHIQQISLAAYKFHKLMIEGLKAQNKVNVLCIVPNLINQKLQGAPPLSREEKDQYVFLGPFFGKSQYFKFIFAALRYVKSQIKKNHNTVLVCDALSNSSAAVCVLAKWIYRTKTVAIITDLPQYLGESVRTMNKKIRDSLTLWIMNRFSAYVLLAGPMNPFVNKRARPYTVMEGLCDAGMERLENKLSEKYHPKVCLYAGSIHREYGIDLLVQAFGRLKLKDCVLRIYGQGDYHTQIEEICSRNSSIEYCGLAPNAAILNEERRATLLINPRPTIDAYVRYSFPSKTLEYMASGTPLLTTKLPSMPDEYGDYVYFIESETVEGIEEALNDLLTRPADELHNKGLAAKVFVLDNKNNIVQSKKMMELIYSI